MRFVYKNQIKRVLFWINIHMALKWKRCLACFFSLESWYCSEEDISLCSKRGMNTHTHTHTHTHTPCKEMSESDSDLVCLYLAPIDFCEKIEVEHTWPPLMSQMSTPVSFTIFYHMQVMLLHKQCLHGGIHSSTLSFPLFTFGGTVGKYFLYTSRKGWLCAVTASEFYPQCLAGKKESSCLTSIRAPVT